MNPGPFRRRPEVYSCNVLYYNDYSIYISSLLSLSLYIYIYIYTYIYIYIHIHIYIYIYICIHTYHNTTIVDHCLAGGAEAVLAVSPGVPEPVGAEAGLQYIH